MTQTRARIVTRDFVLLFIGNFVIVSIYFLLMTTMAYYAVNSYGVESSIAGLTASVFLVGAVLGRILCGRFASAMGPKRLGVLSMAVQVAMCVLYLVADLGVGFLIAVRLVHGLAFGIGNTVLPALAVDGLPPSRLGEGTGYYMLSNSLGVGVGPLMSILVVLGFDYRVLFAICLALSVVALVVTALAKQAHPARTSGSEAGAAAPSPSGPSPAAASPKPRSRGLASILDTSTFAFSVFMFLVALAYSSLNAFINSYAIELGMGMFAPFVFLVYSATLVVTRLVTGRLQDRYGDNCVLYPSIASMAVGLLLAAFTSNPVMLLACGVFMATGFGTCMSVGQAAALKLSRCGDASRTISTFFLLCDSGCGIGPFFLGFVVSGAGYQAMYVLCAGIAACALLYYHFVHGRKDGRPAKAAQQPGSAK